MKKLPVLISFLFFTLFLWSANPVPYSGKVAIRGVNYFGDAQFTFSLQDKDGKTHWRNGKSKDDSIKVNIRNGRYTVLLGGQGMNVLPPQLFLDYDELYLKVRFDDGDGKGFRHLAPDQRITATPRALVAEVAKTANSVKAGGVTASQIKNNTITTAQLNEQILKYLKPEITLAPQAPGLIFNGQTITLHSRVEGKYLNYQWYKNGKAITGADKKRHVIEDVNGTRHDGNYTLVVAQIFLSQLNSIEQTAGRLPTGWKYVLPTEAQWEYACRAGTTTAYSWGNDINSSRANYNWDGGGNDGNDFKQTRDVGQYAANPWGFFDMQGNVWEWVSDWKANYLTGAQTNPEGPASGSHSGPPGWFLVPRRGRPCVRLGAAAAPPVPATTTF